MNIGEYIKVNFVRSTLVILFPVMQISAQQECKQQEERTKETKEVLQPYEEAFLQKDTDVHLKHCGEYTIMCYGLS